MVKVDIRAYNLRKNLEKEGSDWGFTVYVSDDNADDSAEDYLVVIATLILGEYKHSYANVVRGLNGPLNDSDFHSEQEKVLDFIRKVNYIHNKKKD